MTLGAGARFRCPARRRSERPVGLRHGRAHTPSRVPVLRAVRGTMAVGVPGRPSLHRYRRLAGWGVLAAPPGTSTGRAPSALPLPRPWSAPCWRPPPGPAPSWWSGCASSRPPCCSPPSASRRTGCPTSSSCACRGRGDLVVIPAGGGLASARGGAGREVARNSAQGLRLIHRRIRNPPLNRGRLRSPAESVLSSKLLQKRCVEHRSRERMLSVQTR